ncbi:MAG: hypothetical protein KC684_06325 [Candidatus Omnitrophica bacterium]|nr:hypothetical protein [Candidatus Omnitrophota bacterium]
MKYIRKNKILFSLLLTAVLGLMVFSIGGEYLHNAIHHHEQGTEQTCPYFHFLVQAFIAIVIILTTLKLQLQIRFASFYNFIYSQIFRITVHPRGPPLFA